MLGARKIDEFQEQVLMKEQLWQLDYKSYVPVNNIIATFVHFCVTNSQEIVSES